jgi:pyruvate dehydrogenase E2 component (dihydrolipoyllysine-residue acetyltransferase)
MVDSRIRPIVMPKWGLSMSEGKVTGWLMKPGAMVEVGDELLEVETEKIASVVEAGDAGTLRRIIGEPGTVYPVKALLGVLADDDVTDTEIDAFVAGYVTPAAAAEEEEAGPQYLFADLSFGRVRFAKRGEGKAAIVLVHGFGGDLDNWLFNIDALAQQARVYAFDLPGHGQSSKDITDPTLHGLSQALVAFMDVVGVGTAHLVGHSLGGAVAMQTAIDAPDRVQSLSLIGSAGLGPEINADYIDAFITAASRRELKPALEHLFARKELVSRQLVDDVLKYKRLDGVDEALKKLSSALFPGGRQHVQLGDALRDTNIPILVVWGEHDEIIPARHTTTLAGNARTHVMGGAGHMVQMEAANAINSLLKEHIVAGR